MSEDRTRILTDAGPPWNQNLLMVGPRGPVVFELREDGALQP